MPFSLIQSRTSPRSKPMLCVVPTQWVAGNHVFRPPIEDFIKYSRDESSEPDRQSWNMKECRVVAELPTHSLATAVMRTLEKAMKDKRFEADWIGTKTVPKERQRVTSAIQLPEVHIIPKKEPTTEEAHQMADENVLDNEELDYQPMNILIEPFLCAVKSVETRIQRVESAVNEQYDLLQAIEDKLENQTALLEKLLDVMQNVDNQTAPKRSLIDDQRFRRSELSKIYTIDDLRAFDAYLNNNVNEGHALTNFIQILNVNTRRDGTLFFNELMGKIMSPDLAIPYPYEGKSNFKENFPNFIRFVRLLTSLVDFDYAAEKNDENFSNYVNKKYAEKPRREPEPENGGQLRKRRRMLRAAESERREEAIITID